ncbi:MAG: Mov34/MPN/PAD-1 family protein [Candidatus Hodarchaeota archaeon]
MQKELHLSQGHLTLLHNYSEDSLPLEAVALLFGQIQEEVIRVTRVEQVENTSVSSTISFSVDPEIEYALLIEAENQNEEMVAIFHSHPAPPRPSPRDLRNMKLNPVVWLIASKISGRWESRAFLLDNEDATIEIELVLFD